MRRDGAHSKAHGFPTSLRSPRAPRTFPHTLSTARFLILIATLWSSLATADPIPPLVFQQRTLPNGLQFIWLEAHDTPTVAINVWYRVGSKDDPDGRSGFAHLFEHMMFKSTRRMPGEFLDRLTEDVGGENNAFTADDVTVYHEIVPSNHLERLIWAEAERLSSLNVDEGNFHTERDVVKEEYRQRVLAEPYGEFEEFVLKKSFAVHPYKRPTIGNIKELDAAKLSEVRAFHASFYRPDNAVLVVAGDFDPAQLQRWVDRYFGPIRRPDPPIPQVTDQEPPRKAARTIREFDAKVPLPAVAFTFLCPKVASSETSALMLLAEVLGGGDSSRLYQSLVYEKQLAQSVAFVDDQRADAGLLTCEMVLASGVTVEKIEAAFRSEIEALIARGISGDELTTARNLKLLKELTDRETNNGKAMALGYAAALLGDPGRANTMLTDLLKVTAAQVQEAAARWFADPNWLTIEYLPASMKTKDKVKK